MRLILALVFVSLSTNCVSPAATVPSNGATSTASSDCSEYAKASARLERSEAERIARSNENQSRKLELGFGNDKGRLPPSHKRPIPLRGPVPTTPYCAMSYNRSATCEVVFDVSVEGPPINLDPYCSDSIFNKEVVRAVSAVRFTPATIDGKPVEYPGVVYPISFDIQTAE